MYCCILPFDVTHDFKFSAIFNFSGIHYALLCSAFKVVLIKLSMFKEVAYSNVLFTLLNVFFTLALPLLFLDNDFIALLTAQALAYQMALLHIIPN